MMAEKSCHDCKSDKQNFMLMLIEIFAVYHSLNQIYIIHLWSIYIESIFWNNMATLNITGITFVYLFIIKNFILKT